MEKIVVYKVDVEFSKERIINENTFDLETVINSIKECVRKEGVEVFYENTDHTFSFGTNNRNMYEAMVICLIKICKSNVFSYIDILKWHNYDTENVEDVIKTFNSSGFVLSDAEKPPKKGKEKNMYDSIITLKDNLTAEQLRELKEIANAAFDNRAGKLVDISNDPFVIKHSGGDEKRGCLDLGIISLTDNTSFLEKVRKWDWIDHDDPDETCDVIEEFSKPIRR